MPDKYIDTEQVSELSIGYNYSEQKEALNFWRRWMGALFIVERYIAANRATRTDYEWMNQSIMFGLEHIAKPETAYKFNIGLE